MNIYQIGVLWIALIVFVIGFLVGILVTVAQPIYVKHWHDAHKAKESRQRMHSALDKLQDAIANKAVEDFKKGQ